MRIAIANLLITVAFSETAVLSFWETGLNTVIYIDCEEFTAQLTIIVLTVT